jgi:hypothetical protein
MEVAGPDTGEGEPAAGAAFACPLGVEGATLDAVDTPDGVDILVTGPAERVSEIRTRAHDAASLYGPGAHRGLGHHGRHHLGAQRHGLRLTELPPLEATAVDLEGGARIQLAAKLPSQADEIRRRTRERVETANAGPCD